MLHICLPQQYGLSVCHTNTNLDTSCRLNIIMSSRLLGPVTKILAKAFQGIKKTLLSAGTKPKVINVVDLRSYPLSCIATLLWKLMLSVFLKDTIA